MCIRFGFLPVIFIMFVFVVFMLGSWATGTNIQDDADDRAYNGSYTGIYLNRIAFPIGGIGAGMICLEGRGAVSHVSVRNVIDFFNEPCMFAALCVKGEENTARILEGPVPDWKTFGAPLTGNGAAGTSYGLPRFKDVSFNVRFPFGVVKLSDEKIPLEVEITGWSPFVPGNADDASLPVGALEYHFKNPAGKSIDAVFSYNSKNFMIKSSSLHFRDAAKRGDAVLPIKGGFILWQA